MPDTVHQPLINNDRNNSPSSDTLTENLESNIIQGSGSEDNDEAARITVKKGPN
jgi:hypothetical protein